MCVLCVSLAAANHWHPRLASLCRVSELEAALAAADAERGAQRQQLARLKQQMLNEQEDEEDKIR